MTGACLKCTASKEPHPGWRVAVSCLKEHVPLYLALRILRAMVVVLSHSDIRHGAP